MKYLLIAACLVLVTLSTPKTPVWPAQFSQEFHETNTYPVIGSFETDGFFQYDMTNGRYRVDRTNGKGDRYCWLNGIKILQGKKCSHIVDQGKRYIYYPDNDECCYCCSAEHGCGLLRQDWLKGADFKGEVEINGIKAYKWDKKGGQSNFYYETIAEDPLDRVQI